MYPNENFVLFNFLAASFVIITLLVVYYNWKRRWLYYHASKIPGPLALPLLGSYRFLLDSRSEHVNAINRLAKNYLPIFKLWFGPTLYVCTARPEDIEIILPRVLEKWSCYQFLECYMKSSLFIAPVDVWKERRKVINKTFHPSIIKSFFTTFVKQADKLADDLRQNCENGKAFGVLPKVWKRTFATACETLADVDPNLLHGKTDYLMGITKVQNIILKSFYNPLLYIDFIWKKSVLRQKGLDIYNSCFNFVEQIIAKKNSSPPKTESRNDDLKEKRFLNHLLDLARTDEKYRQVVFDETILMLDNGSETPAVAISFVLLMLGMHPQIQDKIVKELSQLFKDKNEISLEDVNRLEYLERVIKETLRLFPPLPVIIRTLDEDVHLDEKHQFTFFFYSYVLPKNSRTYIMISVLHRRPDLWPDPLKFNPDRFLPEEVKKRHRCAYIPFSFGPRNCIGPEYGMLLMKVMLSVFLRRYKVVESVDYKTVEEVDTMFYFVDKAKKGYGLVLEKRE